MKVCFLMYLYVRIKSESLSTLLEIHQVARRKYKMVIAAINRLAASESFAHASSNEIKKREKLRNSVFALKHIWHSVD